LLEESIEPMVYEMVVKEIVNYLKAGCYPYFINSLDFPIDLKPLEALYDQNLIFSLKKIRDEAIEE